jgi:two-component system, OmpR family, sensor kinase
LAIRAVIEHARIADLHQVDLGVARREPVSVMADADKLGIALDNLLSNAIRYTQPGGNVDVSVWRRDGTAMLEVLDTGIGIPPEERARVFDRFFRSVDNDQTGSGLGLAIVKKVIDLHRGTITLADGDAGRGLRVTIRFPIT